MQKFIRNRLLEALAIPSFNLPKKVDVNLDLIHRLTSLTWADLIIDNNGDDGVSTLYMNVRFKDDNLNSISDGIVFTIQLIQDTYYQPHLFMTPKLQGIGLGPKILKAFIMEYGHIYAGTGRTLNQDANKMLGKLTKDGDLESFSDNYGVLILKKGIPNKDELLRIIKN